jgi:hypothetical protein
MAVLHLGELGIADRNAPERNDDSPVSQSLVVQREPRFQAGLQVAAVGDGRLESHRGPARCGAQGRQQEVTFVREVGADDGRARTGGFRHPAERQGGYSFSCDKLRGKVGDVGTLAGTIDLDWHSAIMPKS